VATKTKEETMPRRQLLTLALKLDAVVTGANAIAYLALAEPLGDLFGMPEGFLRAVGAFLAVFAVAVWQVATRAQSFAPLVVAANAGWVVASLGAVVADWHAPDTVGTVWIVLQAGVVAGFALLQLAALRLAGAAIPAR
jgi:hypothetical protein